MGAGARGPLRIGKNKPGSNPVGLYMSKGSPYAVSLYLKSMSKVSLYV